MIEAAAAALITYRYFKKGAEIERNGFSFYGCSGQWLLSAILINIQG